MGCDIHAVIEFEKWDLYWGYAEVSLPRDPRQFSAIAFGEGGITDDLPYPPRGLPFDHSLRVSLLFFVGADELKDLANRFGEEFNPEEAAKSWGDWALTKYRECGALPGPDFHTPSWLSLPELKHAVMVADLDISNQSPEFRATVCAMESLSDAYGADKTRLVFWFDG